MPTFEETKEKWKAIHGNKKLGSLNNLRRKYEKMAKHTKRPADYARLAAVKELIAPLQVKGTPGRPQLPGGPTPAAARMRRLRGKVQAVVPVPVNVPVPPDPHVPVLVDVTNSMDTHDDVIESFVAPDSSLNSDEDQRERSMQGSDYQSTAPELYASRGQKDDSLISSTDPLLAFEEDFPSEYMRATAFEASIDAADDDLEDDVTRKRRRVDVIKTDAENDDEKSEIGEIIREILGESDEESEEFQTLASGKSSESLISSSITVSKSDSSRTVSSTDLRPDVAEKYHQAKAKCHQLAALLERSDTTIALFEARDDLQSSELSALREDLKVALTRIATIESSHIEQEHNFASTSSQVADDETSAGTNVHAIICESIQLLEECAFTADCLFRINSAYAAKKEPNLTDIVRGRYISMSEDEPVDTELMSNAEVAEKLLGEMRTLKETLARTHKLVQDLHAQSVADSLMDCPILKN